jgi:hypothetical protein
MKLKEQTIISLSNRQNQKIQTSTPNQFVNEIIIENTKSHNIGSAELSRSDTNWYDIANGFNSKYIRIKSADIFHYRITTDNGLLFICSSTVLSYNNPKNPVKIEVANGTMDIDYQSGILSSNVVTKDIKIDYLIVNY